MATETLQWIDVAGNVTNLTDYSFSSYFAEGPLPAVGQFGLPLTIVSHQVPLMPGVREQYVQIAANDLRFPLIVFGPDEPSLQYNIRQLSEAMRPTRGVGILQHISSDGITTRQLFCRETARLRDVVSRGPGWCRFGMVFSAADPFWYDANFYTLSFTPGSPVAFFQNPFLPLHISSGGISSNFTIYNGGQDIAWPIWTITGPGTNPILTNTTTGQTLTLSISLAANQVLTVDTRPIYINVTRENGSNQWSAVSDVSQMWGFVPGANAVTLSISGTTSASSLQLQYKQCYEGV